MAYLGNEPAYGTHEGVSHVGDGSTTTFELPTSPGSKYSTLVFVDGVKQAHADFDLINSTIVFSSAPANGANIEITFLSVLVVDPTEPNVTSQRASIVATAGQTQFNITFKPGYIDMYKNGLKLSKGVQFNEGPNGEYVTLVSPASAGDVIELVAYNVRHLSEIFPEAELDDAYQSYLVQGQTNYTSVDLRKVTGVTKPLVVYVRGNASDSDVNGGTATIEIYGEDGEYHTYNEGVISSAGITLIYLHELAQFRIVIANMTNPVDVEVHY